MLLQLKDYFSTLKRILWTNLEDLPQLIEELQMVGSFTNGTYGGNSRKYTHPSGINIHYHVQPIGSQCGVRNLHGISVPKGIPQEVSNDFAADLVVHYHRHHNKYAKLLVSAVVGSSLHRLCKQCDEWQYGTKVRNPNSGNYIRMFELDIYKAGVEKEVAT